MNCSGSIGISQPKEKGDAIKKEKETKGKPPHPSHPRLPQDPLAIRTIVISGLPSSIDSKVLWKKIRKYQGAEKLNWPIKVSSGDEDPTTGASPMPYY
jgi:nucleolar protein 4